MAARMIDGDAFPAVRRVRPESLRRMIRACERPAQPPAALRRLMAGAMTTEKPKKKVWSPS